MLLETPICDFSEKLQDFSLEDFDGNIYLSKRNFSENNQKKAFLVMFICNHCPYVKAVIERLVKDAKDLQEIGVEIVAVMSNDYLTYEDDSPENMKKFAKKHDFSFSYLVDKNQEVAKKLGAVCTPDFFGFNKNGELRYRGRLDDLGIKGGDESLRSKELFEAMTLIAKNGDGPQNQKASMGCSIKWKY